VQTTFKNESQIKDIFQWDGEDVGFTKRTKAQKLQSHCSKKFQTEQRDQYRWFVEQQKGKESEELVNDEGAIDERKEGDKENQDDLNGSSSNLN